MKKLLVLSLVLGIASLASAALDPDFAIGASGGPGVWNITLTGEAAGRGLYYLMVVDGNPGVLSGLALNANAGDTASFVTYTEAGWTSSAYELTIADKDSDAQILAGTWATATLTITGTPVTLQLYKDGLGYGANDYIAQTIIVPEPATLALLGLGALVLRRKK